ncbi:hypothetical protein [Cellulomonas telluris]|uniref:hypothetical protein n=1 Tax=Cellulomonas telluris TaxID=2306636 RepID=UPI0010A7E6EC|nr:hypothetical protein [Cellulomonas telluris]
MPTIDAQELLGSWSSSASRMDEFTLVSDVLEAAARAGHAEDLELERARAAVVAGRPALAAGLLADVDRDVLTGETHTWRTVVAVAAWAAQGDTEALAALIRVGQGMERGPALTHRYLLAAAAEQAGQSDLADATWREIQETTNAPTQTVQRRVLAADVARRSTTDVDAAGAVVGGTVRTLVEAHPMPEDGLNPTRDVVTRLEERGDRAGAWLLLEGIAALRPLATGVRQMRDERRSGGGWWHERLPGLAAAVAAAALVVVAGLAPLPAWVPALASVAAATVWRRWRLPQGTRLGRVDARLLSQVRAFPPDIPNGHRWGLRRVGAIVTGGAAGFLLAVVVTGVLVEGPLAELNRTHTAAVDAVAWPLVLLALVLGGAAGPHLLTRTLREPAQRWVDEARARTVEQVRGCVCVRTLALRGVEVDAYTTGHLRAADADVAALAPSLPSATVAVHQCPLSGTPWLRVQLPDREPVLLRGTLTRVQDEPERAVGGYL